MKKKIKFLLTIILLLTISSIQAGSDESTCYDDSHEPSFCFQEACCNTFSVEAQYAAFFPVDSKVRRIYGSALPAFTLEGNWRYQCWDLWLNGSYIFGHGHSTGPCKNKTHLNLVPISLGVKYLYSLCDCMEVYFGLGACYSFLNTRDHSEFVHEKVSSKGFGGVIKTGFVYNYCENFFLEGVLNYTYQRFTFSSTSVDPFVYRQDANLSSLQLGLGFGLKF